MAKSVTIRDIRSAYHLMQRCGELVNHLLQSGPVVVSITRPSKSREMEKKYHAMIHDIHMGAFRGNSYDGVKALMVAEFAEEMKQQGTPLTHPGETVYSHKLKEWVTVRASTKKFRKAEGVAFIEFLYAMGVELGIRWSEPALAIYAEYREAQQGRKAA